MAATACTGVCASITALSMFSLIAVMLSVTVPTSMLLHVFYDAILCKKQIVQRLGQHYSLTLYGLQKIV